MVPPASVTNTVLFLFTGTQILSDRKYIIQKTWPISVTLSYVAKQKRSDLSNDLEIARFCVLVFVESWHCIVYRISSVDIVMENPAVSVRPNLILVRSLPGSC